jgi:hypothetical protein
MTFNWLYTSWNDNEYILFLIVMILTFIIINFGLWKRKKDKFIHNDNRTNRNTHNTDKFYNITTPETTTPETTTPETTTPETTSYQAPTETNPANNIFVSDEEKAKWRKAWVQLDGNPESSSNNTLSASNNAIQNDILQLDSTLYNQPTSNATTDVKTVNYDKLGNYATIDDLGKSLTDTLGGINSNLGYTMLSEQLGTFKPNYNNPNAYDNTQSYKTDMNPNAVDGISAMGYGQVYQKVGKSGTPIIMQKDFAGVANIFAPNIYISNPPLNSDGYPNISYSV